MKTNKKGFTLAELLIVVAVIAIMVAIAIPTFSNQMEKSRQAVDIQALRSAYSAAVMTQMDGYYGGVTTNSVKNKTLYYNPNTGELIENSTGITGYGRGTSGAKVVADTTGLTETTKATYSGPLTAVHTGSIIIATFDSDGKVDTVKFDSSFSIKVKDTISSPGNIGYTAGTTNAWSGTATVNQDWFDVVAPTGMTGTLEEITFVTDPAPTLTGYDLNTDTAGSITITPSSTSEPAAVTEAGSVSLAVTVNYKITDGNDKEVTGSQAINVPISYTYTA